MRYKEGSCESWGIDELDSGIQYCIYGNLVLLRECQIDTVETEFYRDGMQNRKFG